MSQLKIETLEKNTFVKVNEKQFRGLMAQCEVSDTFKAINGMIDLDTVFMNVDEDDEDLPFFHVYVGDMVSNAPVNFEGFNTLVVGNVKAPWVNLENVEPFDEGGSFIVIGNIDCDHFNTHWGKMVVVDGNLNANKLAASNFEDSALFISGNFDTEFFTGWADVGGAVCMTYGDGYCMPLNMATNAEFSEVVIKPQHSIEDSYAFLEIEGDVVDESNVTDYIASCYED